MKKRTAKLSLSRETVRNLLTSQLGQAAGGTFLVTDRCGVSQYCPGFPTSAGRLVCDFACVDPNNPIETEGTW